MSSETLEKNKAMAAKLIDDLFGSYPVTEEKLKVIDEVVHENYIQHNPMAGQGREGLRNFVVNVLPKTFVDGVSPLDSPVLKVNLIAEGDMVVRHEIRKDWMLVDIFRVRDGLLAEHWDALRVPLGAKQWPGF